MLPIVKTLKRTVNVPVIVKANAGMPSHIDGKAVDETVVSETVTKQPVNEVMLVGVGERIEVWDKQRYDEYNANLDISAIAAKLAANGVSL